MRKLFGFVVIAALAVAGQARAAAVPFTGSLTIEISVLTPITMLGAGSAILNGSGSLGHLSSIALAGGTFATAVSIPITDPAAAPIQGIVATAQNGAGSFTTGVDLGGLMAISGTAIVCLFGMCNASPPANLNIPFTSGGVNGVGLGGAPVTSTFLVNVSVTGAPWTTGTVTVMTPIGFLLGSRSGFAHGPASAGASSAAAASGVLQLVTPVQITTSVPGSGTIPAFGILQLHFVPEPGTLLLVASGVAALGLLGRRRMSK